MSCTSHARVLAFDRAFFTWNASQIVSVDVMHAHTRFKCALHNFRGWHGLSGRTLTVYIQSEFLSQFGTSMYIRHRSTIMNTYAVLDMRSCH